MYKSGHSPLKGHKAHLRFFNYGTPSIVTYFVTYTNILNPHQYMWIYLLTKAYKLAIIFKELC